MKTVILQEEMEYLGRIRQKGEVVIVPDNSSLGRTLTTDIGGKNKKKLELFKKKREKKEKEGKKRGKAKQD